MSESNNVASPDEFFETAKRTCVFEISSPIELLTVYAVCMDGVAVASLQSVQLSKTVEEYNKLVSSSSNPTYGSNPIHGRFGTLKYGTVSASMRRSLSYSKKFPGGGSLTITSSVMDLRKLLCTEIRSAF